MDFQPDRLQKSLVVAEGLDCCMQLEAVYIDVLLYFLEGKSYNNQVFSVQKSFVGLHHNVGDSFCKHHVNNSRQHSNSVTNDQKSHYKLLLYHFRLTFHVEVPGNPNFEIPRKFDQNFHFSGFRMFFLVGNPF